MSEVTEIKDGDIFRWTCAHAGKDPYTYWCKSQIAIARNGWLADTYWGASGSRVGWAYSDAASAVDLEYLGNLNDLVAADPWTGEYYDDSDIVDIRHPNATSCNFYIRKGAIRSAKKMLEVAQRRHDSAISDIQSAQRRSSEMTAVIVRIKSGEPLDSIYL